jgi:hypothetical protein
VGKPHPRLYCMRQRAVIVYFDYLSVYILRNFQIKKYPNYFLWDGLLARPYPERAGELIPQNWRIYFL